MLLHLVLIGVIFLLTDVKHEKCVRKTFARIGDIIEMPNLIKVQKDSYEWFKIVITFAKSEAIEI